MSFLNQHSNLLQPSATLAISAAAGKLKAEGKDVINLSVGQPDFKSPAHVCEAAKAAVDAGHHGYTPAGGLPALKEAVQSKYLRDLGVDYSLSEITCSNGGKQILFNLFSVILNLGDEVILSDPAWLTYATQIKWAGGVPVFVSTQPEDGFCMKPEAVQAAITQRTKVILINSPANPTGGVMPAEDLRAIAELAQEKGLLIVSDDVYEFFSYGEPAAHVLKLMPELKEQVVCVNAVSKSYAMTGWRIGFAAGPGEIIGKMQSLQSQEASNPCAIAQHAAITALNGPQDFVTEMMQAFVRRRQIIADWAESQNRIPVVLPQGAFYAMLDVRALMKDGESDVEFCERFLNEKHVALVPGSVFGDVTAGWLRMSFAASDEEVSEALERLNDYVQ